MIWFTFFSKSMNPKLFVFVLSFSIFFRCRLISSLYKSVSERVWSEYQAQAKKGHLEYINPLNMNHESGILELWEWNISTCHEPCEKCSMATYIGEYWFFTFFKPNACTNHFEVWDMFVTFSSSCWTKHYIYWKKLVNKDINKNLFQKMYNEYELHGMTDEKIRTAHFNQVSSNSV